MKLIKCASMYRINLPSAATLSEHLQELPFTELSPSSMSGAGFVPVPATHEIVSSFIGGLAFALRYDEKILPSTVIASETKKRIEQMQQEQYRRIGKKESREIKEMVANELCSKALSRSAVMVSYYHPDTKTLIVPTTSQRIADLVTSLLVRAVGSITSQTINVSDVKGGLTTRLRAHISGDAGAFEEFRMGNDVWLQNAEGRLSIQSDSIHSAHNAIEEAMANGKQVTAVQLTHVDTTFRLTDSFKLKNIQFNYQPENAGAVDAVEAWLHEASIQMLHISGVVEALCRLFSYKDDLKQAA